MANTLSMTIADPLEYFFEVTFSHTLGQSFFLPQQPPQRLFACIFHNQVQLLMFPCQLVQLDYFRMIQQTQMSDFPLDARQSVPIQRIDLLIGLHCVALPPILPHSRRNDREGALPDMRYKFQPPQSLFGSEEFVKIAHLLAIVMARREAAWRIDGGLPWRFTVQEGSGGWPASRGHPSMPYPHENSLTHRGNGLLWPQQRRRRDVFPHCIENYLLKRMCKYYPLQFQAVLRREARGRS